MIDFVFFSYLTQCGVHELGPVVSKKDLRSTPSIDNKLTKSSFYFPALRYAQGNDFYPLREQILHYENVHESCFTSG